MASVVMASVVEGCFKTSAICNFLSAVVLLAKPPTWLLGQGKRYAQLCGVGFLSVGIISWSLREPAAVLAAVAYNGSFALLTWPLRVPSQPKMDVSEEGSYVPLSQASHPEINAAERFFVVMAAITSLGMLSSLFL